jgi:hypothetical protein
VQLLPPAAHRRDKVRRLEDGEMLANRLADHLQLRAELAQGLAVTVFTRSSRIRRLGSAQRPEDLVHPWIGSHPAAE